MPKETSSTPAENEFDDSLDEQVDHSDAETDSQSAESDKERVKRSKEVAAKATSKKNRPTPKRPTKTSRKAEAEAEQRASMTKEQLRHSGKKAKEEANPVWFKPIMFGFLILGFLWIIVYYISGGVIPVQTLGDWNILVGFGIAMVGFLMMTNWK